MWEYMENTCVNDRDEECNEGLKGRRKGVIAAAKP